MRRPFAALTLLILVLHAAPLMGQSSQLWRELTPGERVRIEAPGILAARLATTVVARSGDSVRVRARERRNTIPGEEHLDYLVLPLAGITSVEVSKGRSHVIGAIVGAASGAAVAVALVALDNRRPEELCLGEPCPTRRNKTANLIKGAEVGSAVGGLLGLAFGREQWRRVDLASKVSLAPAAARGMLALRARF